MERITFPPRIIFDEREKDAILRVVEKTMTGPEAIDMYGKGPEVASYEKEFAEYFGVKYAAAVSSGTAAVHSAVGALRLEPGSEIITTPITDPGTVAPILMQNCIPIFADVEYDTLNISPKSIEKNITDKTRAIIAVHLAGQPCDMDPIMEIARRHNLYVIEDCAQAHGARYKGRYVGTMGDLGVFSLMAGKHMNSGGQGGMVITNNEELYWNAKRFSDRGKPFNSEEKTNLLLGLNYRMTELQAAVGRVQLTKLADIKGKRRWVVERLREGTSGLKMFQLWRFIDNVEVNPW
ncbi:MAG TPA: DegT/DnrJ/EryC1/StrS family aminotransferase, partial [bacterium]|nr:DegT/DnrJ/EryC1/StrS family aminotransferase [bacterium]